jgi:hypothetical protein
MGGVGGGPAHHERWAGTVGAGFGRGVSAGSREQGRAPGRRAQPAFQPPCPVLTATPPPPSAPAFVFPGGKICVYTGLLTLLDRDADLLAMVMG